MQCNATMKPASSPQATMATRYEDILLFTLYARALMAAAMTSRSVVKVCRDNLGDLLSHASVLCCTVVGRGLAVI
jgi:hypothetical protein